MVEHDRQIGREALKLHDPVSDGAERRDDQVRAKDLLLVQVREEGDGLQRFAEALRSQRIPRPRRTISSARMPFRPLRYSWSSHEMPSSW